MGAAAPALAAGDRARRRLIRARVPVRYCPRLKNTRRPRISVTSAADAGFDPLFRDVARLRAGMIRVDDADMKEIEERLSPLAAAGQPFRSSARELIGLAALKFNDLDQAGRMFDQIVTDTESPAAMKQRAEAFLGLVRSDRKPK